MMGQSVGTVPRNAARSELPLSFVEVSLCSGLTQFCAINTLKSRWNCGLQTWSCPEQWLGMFCSWWCWSGVPVSAPALTHVLFQMTDAGSLVLQVKAGQGCEMTESETSYIREFPISPHFPHTVPISLASLKCKIFLFPR